MTKKEYSGLVTYVEVEGGVSAIDIYRPDLEFSDDDKLAAEKVINTISLNNTPFPQASTNTYEIGDKEITLSDHWEKRGSPQAGSMISTQFAYKPLSLRFNVMWHNSGSKQTDEQVKDYFAKVAEEDLFETTIGGEEGYYYINYNYAEDGYNYYGVVICTTGAIYSFFVICDEELEFSDDMYHSFIKMFEESVSKK